jgi:hypothetical protein
MPDHDPFYVGYLPLPRPHRRLLVLFIPLLVLAIAAAAVVVALRQRDPGDGQWQLDHEVTLTGVYVESPYPAVSAKLAGRDEAPRLYLLIAQGKFGAAALCQGIPDRQVVKAAGFVIARDDQRLLELTGPLQLSDTPDELAARAWPQPLRPVNDGPVALTGVIIDPKCYLGVMKPGEGKIHKACAIRCLAGGIPPMLLTRDAEGRPTYYLLADAHGRALAGDPLHRLLPHVAQTITLTGRLYHRPHQLVLQLTQLP